MFKSNLIDLGVVISGVRHSFRFERIGESKKVIRIKASCGCVGVSMESSGDIVGTIRPSSVPYHLKGVGYYDSSKYITVMYSDGSQETLILKMRIKDR